MSARLLRLTPLLLSLSLAACSGGSGGAVPWGGQTVVTSANVMSASGQFGLPESGELVDFAVEAFDEDSGRATFTLPDGSAVVAEVSGPGTATVTWDGMVIDGLGALDEEEAAALAAFDDGLLGQAIRGVPADLGCLAPDLAPSAMAALVFPWQLALLYRSGDPAGEARSFAEASACDYFPGLSDEDPPVAPPTSLLLSRDLPWPVVYGFFPFDEAAFAESEEGTMSQALSAAPIPADPAPCGALCRGACGVDCTTTNCSFSDEWRCDVDDTEANLGTKRKWRIYNCGIHAGCVWHDDCYDTCNGTYPPCGSKRALWCRHNTVTGCDVTAAYYHGHVDCALWATGRGSFSGRMDFPYEVPGTEASDHVECPPAGGGGGNGGEEAAALLAALGRTRCVELTVYGYHVFVGENNGEERDNYYLMVRSCQVGDPTDPNTWPVLNWSGTSFSVSGTGTDDFGNELSVNVSGSVANDGGSLATATGSVESTDGSYVTRFTVGNLDFGGNLNPELGINFGVDGPEACAAHLSAVSAHFFSYTQTYAYDRTEWTSADTSWPWIKVSFGVR